MDYSPCFYCIAVVLFGLLLRLYYERSKKTKEQTSDTVVGEKLAVFRMPQIRKTDKCLDGQVGKTFLKICGGSYDF